MMKKYLLFFCIIFLGSAVFANVSNKGEYKWLADIVQSDDYDLSEKFDMINADKSLSFEARIELYDYLYPYMIKSNNVDLRLAYYSQQAINHIYIFKLDKVKFYLDKASELSKQINNPKVLAIYYHATGDYHNHYNDEVQAHLNYYKCLEYYEKTETPVTELIPVFYNLSFTYIQKEDTFSLKKIIDKIEEPIKKSGDWDDLETLYIIKAYYYGCLSKNNKDDKNYLDSVILYNRKAIEIYEKTPDNPFGNEIIAYIYNYLATNLLEKEEIDTAYISNLISKSGQLAHPLDTTMLVNNLWASGQMHYQSKEYRQAKSNFINQMHLMNKWNASDNLMMYTNLYNILSEISYQEKEYLQAWEYERMKSEYLKQVSDKEKYEIIQDLQTKYEVEKKEQEINFLTQKDKTNKLIISLICVLGVFFLIAMVFIIRYLRRNKQYVEAELRYTLLDKELKEGELEIERLEKCEAKLAVLWKSEELLKKDEELKNLKTEREQYIQTQKKKLEKSSPDKWKVILWDLQNKISKTHYIPKERRNEYLHRLDKMDYSFLSNLYQYYQGKLSTTNIYYCVCFALGMKIEYISTCLSVETGSIHTARKRLKSSFGLTPDDDLDLFLKGFI
ncbi:hypothetical protein D0T49_02915 [Paludibacter sp. 221]|uniref:hypothetical protein n=1 Tax=Paludibacter sp. 221 TaxID=2302939 RepID=UPI0013CF8527|nr:hypothetical protein [Paludibacter sp. 221]NDV45990.1 hypothetical protein [Paludibacter sp. 221]